MNKNIANYTFIQQLTLLPYVEEIWLFGSRARGDNQERSDIDLAILCPHASAHDWLAVVDIIENADTLLKIDCVRFDTLQKDDSLKLNIERFKKLIYKKGNIMEEIYWRDYFYTLGNSISRLQEVMEHPDLNKHDYMQDAAIQRFEFVTELFWKVLKKALLYEKIDTTTPRDVLSKAYQYKIIDDEILCLKMLSDRNSTSHVYREEVAKRVFQNIHLYLPVFMNTYEKLKKTYRL